MSKTIFSAQNLARTVGMEAFLPAVLRLTVAPDTRGRDTPEKRRSTVPGVARLLRVNRLTSSVPRAVRPEKVGPVFSSGGQYGNRGKPAGRRKVPESHPGPQADARLRAKSSPGSVAMGMPPKGCGTDAENQNSNQDSNQPFSDECIASGDRRAGCRRCLAMRLTAAALPPGGFANAGERSAGRPVASVHAANPRQRRRPAWQLPIPACRSAAGLVTAAGCPGFLPGGGAALDDRRCHRR